MTDVSLTRFGSRLLPAPASIAANVEVRNEAPSDRVTATTSTRRLVDSSFATGKNLKRRPSGGILCSMTVVFFKCQLVAGGVRLNPAGLPARFAVRRTHEVAVTLRLPNDEELELGFRPENAQCEGQMHFEPNDRIVEALESLANHRLPNGRKTPSEWAKEFEFVDEEGKLLDNHMAPWEALPQSLQSYLKQSASEVEWAIRAAVGVLRWRLADEGAISRSPVEGVSSPSTARTG